MRRFATWLLVPVFLTLVVAGAVYLSWPKPAKPPEPLIPTIAEEIAVSTVPPLDLPAPKPRPADLVGSAVCAECHAEIAESFARHPMGRASSVAAASTLEDYTDHTSFAVPGGLRFLVERTADAVVHHETRFSGDTLLYDQHVAVRWALGSGQRGRSYAFEEDGLLFMSPISWYSQRGKWDLSPGYSSTRPNRFGRRVTDGCLACHVGQANPHGTLPDRFQSPAVIEAAISCERCHGPGQNHVQQHRDNLNASADDPIVNPARLGLIERDSVCYQCHLQGSRRLLRAGRTPYDFRPGQRLDDVWTIFVKSGQVSADGAAESVSQVEQMRTSRCYTGTEGKLGCISCHNPHAAAPVESRAAYYEQRCNSCHESRGCSIPLAKRQTDPRGSACIDCHMPRLSATDIPHTSQTDHRVLRDPRLHRPAEVDPSTQELVLFDEAHTTIPPLELRRARALVRLGDVQSSRAPEAARQLRKEVFELVAALPPDAELQTALGTLSLLVGEAAQAEQYWLDAAAIAPHDETIVQQLAMYYRWRKDGPQARAWFEKYLALNPRNAEVWGLYAQVLSEAGLWPEAILAAEKGLQVDPSLVQLRSWMTSTYRRRGNTPKADKNKLILDGILQGDGGP